MFQIESIINSCYTIFKKSKITKWSRNIIAHSYKEKRITHIKDSRLSSCATGGSVNLASCKLIFSYLLKVIWNGMHIYDRAIFYGTICDVPSYTLSTKQWNKIWHCQLKRWSLHMVQRNTQKHINKFRTISLDEYTDLWLWKCRVSQYALWQFIFIICEGKKKIPSLFLIDVHLLMSNDWWKIIK